jgi:hypothetical protein
LEQRTSNSGRGPRILILPRQKPLALLGIEQRTSDP